MLNPLEINELQKAMMLRGVDYETSELIIRDFRARCVEILGSERYHEIMQAEREGRLVILPCKVGDTVYELQYEYCDRRGRDMCNEYCDGWDVHCPDYEGETEAYETKFDISMIAELGKTVFLTREEAEKA